MIIKIDEEFITPIKSMKPLNIQDNIIEEITECNILPQFNDAEFFFFVKELYRICKPNAIIKIQVPYFKHDNAYSNPGYNKRYCLETFKLFSKEYNQWHIDTYNSSPGFGIKCNVDFEIIEHKYFLDSETENLLNNIPEAEKELFVKRSWNIIKNMILVWKVIK